MEFSSRWLVIFRCGNIKRVRAGPYGQARMVVVRLSYNSDNYIAIISSDTEGCEERRNGTCNCGLGFGMSWKTTCTDG